MQNFLKIVAILAIIGVIVVSSLFVLDAVTSTEMKDILQKVLLILSILALGGLVVSLISRPQS